MINDKCSKFDKDRNTSMHHIYKSDGLFRLFQFKMLFCEDNWCSSWYLLWYKILIVTILSIRIFVMNKGEWRKEIIMFFILVLVISFANAHCKEMDNLISLYHERFQDENAINASYEILDTLLGIHNADHKILNLDEVQVSRQGLVRVIISHSLSIKYWDTIIIWLCLLLIY